MKKTLIISILFLIFICIFSLSANAAVIDTNSTRTEETQPPITGETTTLPSAYSSVELGYVSPVKQQLGSICWAYAANSSFESYLLKNSLLFSDLDVHHIDNWATPDENGEGWQRSTLSAGYGYIPCGYLTSWSGPFDTNGNKVNYGVTAIRYHNKSNHTQIKEAIMRNGSVSADYNSHSSAYNTTNTAFFLIDAISSVNGHSISVVGWDDNYDKENFDSYFYRPNNNGAWLCKNSWGEYNELGGYFWISYEDYYLFNDEVFATSYSIESMQEIAENHNIYQNEIYGATYEFNYIINDNITYFNVFDFSTQGNVLDKIVFESTSEGAEYSAYFVPTENGIPTEDRTQWLLLNKGVVDYRGYICCDVEDIVLSQKKGAIAIQIDTSKLNEGLSTDSENYVENGIGVSEWLRNSNSSSMIFTKKCSPGESFVTFNDKITDISDFYKTELDDSIGGTLVIKAITNDTIDTTIKGDLNSDEQLDINDATYLQRYLVSYITYMMEHQKVNSDFNGDGVININDVTAIQKYLVGIE